MRDGRRSGRARKRNSDAHYQAKSEAGKHRRDQHPSSRLFAPRAGIVQSRPSSDARWADRGICRGGSGRRIACCRRSNRRCACRTNPRFRFWPILHREMKNAYERFVRPLLFSLDAEAAHDLTVAFLQGASHLDLVLRALKIFRPLPKPKTVFGLEFPNPIGLAAGLDKNGVALSAWAALGFGFIEIGTVTARPQPGNPSPRIFRFPEHLALINRLGFNNDGADIVAERLGKLRAAGRWPAVPVGINIGKSKITPREQATADYLYSFQLLREFADYIALNVSSPNTPGLRDLQGAAALSELLRTIASENRQNPKPVLVKIAPDLSPNDLEDLIAICEENEVAGI